MLRHLSAGAVAALIGTVAVSAGEPAAASVQALRGTPRGTGPRFVVLRGTVTALSGWRNSFFFEQDGVGISVDRADEGPDVSPGDEVEIEAWSSDGFFAPVLKARSVRVLGRRELPPPPPRQFFELGGGLQDSQRAELHGIVETAAVTEVWDRRVLAVGLQVDDHLVPLHVLRYDGLEPDLLVDSEIRVRGVVGTIFNDHRQFVGPRVFVNDIADVRVLRPAPADPLAGPARSLRTMFDFESRDRAGHRVKVRGTATLQRPGLVYLQDGDRGALVETASSAPLQPGDVVEVAAFPSAGEYSPVLRNAVLRVVDRSSPPEPVPVDAERVIAPNAEGFLVAPYDALLIRTEGRIVQTVDQADADVLVLRSGNTVFRARMTGADLDLPHLAAGDDVSVTGVCAVRVDRLLHPTSFEIQLRGSADLAVLRRAPWWTGRRVGQLAAVLTVGALGALAWVAVLRRQVRAQTIVIRQQVETLTAREWTLERTREQLQEALIMEKELARCDFLTGLGNRRAFTEAGESEVARARRYERPVAVAIVDLDNFKEVNDRFGHDQGDELLGVVASTMRTRLRATDVAARLGGDEFALLLPETDAAATETVLVKLRTSLLEEMSRRGWPVTFSMGAAVCSGSPDSFGVLLREADRIMYGVKNGGKNGLAVAEVSCSDAVAEAPRPL